MFDRNALVFGLLFVEIMEKNFVLIRNCIVEVLAAKEIWIEFKIVNSGFCQEVVLIGN